MLVLIADGKTSDEIATILNIHTKTVSVYRGNIYRKLDCHNAAQAVSEGRSMGYLEKQ